MACWLALRCWFTLVAVPHNTRFKANVLSVFSLPRFYKNVLQ